MNGLIMLVLGILAMLSIDAVSFEDSKCSDLESMPKISIKNDSFNIWNIEDNNKYNIYEITRNYIGDKCVKMKVQNDVKSFKYYWLKDGGPFTDLNFFINENPIASYVDVANSDPLNFEVKEDDELKWIFTVRDSNLKGKAWIAIPSQPILLEETRIADLEKPNLIAIQPSIYRNDSIPNNNIAFYKAYFNEVIVDDGDLQEKINQSPDYTELILKNPEYIINDTISIENKNNFVIRSSTDYVKFKGGNLDKFLVINNSTFIMLSGIALESQYNGIKINQSSDCIIRDNQIGFNHHRYGILISNLSENIEVSDNLIWVSSAKNNDPSSDILSVGIKIENSKNIHLENNEIRDNGMISFLAYFVADCGSVINTTIIPYCDDPTKDFKIMYGSCLGYWNCIDDIHDEIDSYNNPCKIKDSNDNVGIWSTA